MAGKKKTMGRGLGSLLERRNSVATQPKPTVSSTGTTAVTTSSATTAGSSDSANSTANSTGNSKAGATPGTTASLSASSTANTHTNTPTKTPASPAINAKEDPKPTDADAAPTRRDADHLGSETAESVQLKNAKAHDIAPSGDKLRMLGVDQIKRGTYQPRRHFNPELLQELADSLKSEGLIQPILVRPDGKDRFELIAGERRWRAAQLAGFSEIPAIVRQLDDRAVAAMSLIENIQRKDLNPLEEAEALRRLSDEFGQSHQEVAESVGRSRSAVTNLMRLLELHDDVKALVDVGDIDMGHARALLGAPLDDQPAIARRIAQQGLTVRAVEKQIKNLRAGASSKPANGTVSDPDISRLEKHLSQKLGATVSIRHKKSGSGKLEITYHSMDELDGILNHIK